MGDRCACCGARPLARARTHLQHGRHLCLQLPPQVCALCQRCHLVTQRPQRPPRQQLGPPVRGACNRDGPPPRRALVDTHCRARKPLAHLLQRAPHCGLVHHVPLLLRMERAVISSSGRGGAPAGAAPARRRPPPRTLLVDSQAAGTPLSSTSVSGMFKRSFTPLRCAGWGAAEAGEGAPSAASLRLTLANRLKKGAQPPLKASRSISIATEGPRRGSSRAPAQSAPTRMSVLAAPIPILLRRLTACPRASDSCGSVARVVCGPVGGSGESRAGGAAPGLQVLLGRVPATQLYLRPGEVEGRR